jgi:hypothetical protein
MKIKAEILDRFHGVIQGLAVGDTMSMPLDFTNP